MLPLFPHDKGVVLRVRLTPSAGANAIKGISVDAAGEKWLNVRVTAIPEKGKANLALLKLLSKNLKAPKSDFEIIRGETDRNKAILIHGDTNQMMNEFSNWLAIK